MTAALGNERHALPETSPGKDQSQQMMDNNFDDRLGIEIGSGCIYVAAYDKRSCKPMLLANQDGKTETRLTISFDDDEHVIGEAAQAQQNANAANTFRDLDKLLGGNIQDKGIRDYAKNEKHVIVQQNSRCLLHIPSSNKYQSPEQLIAFVLRKVINFAASKYNSTFRSASFALKADYLLSERMVRAHAEIARLAGLYNLRILPGAAGIVNTFINDCAWYLTPKHAQLPFFIVDMSCQNYALLLVIVRGYVTTLQNWTVHRFKESQLSFDQKFGLMLQDWPGWTWDDVQHGVGVVFSDPKFPDAADRTTIVSRVRHAIQASPTELVVHEMDSQGAACLGLVYDGKNPKKLTATIEASAYYPVHMAVLGNDTKAEFEDSVQLFDRFDKLAYHASISLSGSSIEQNGVFLRFFTNNTTLSVNEYALTEVAIEFPQNHRTDTFEVQTFRSPTHAMFFFLVASDGHLLALIHYSVDGLVRIESESLVPVTPRMRKDWLPKLVRHHDMDLPAASIAKVVGVHPRNKRARLV